MKRPRVVALEEIDECSPWQRRRCPHARCFESSLGPIERSRPVGPERRRRRLVSEHLCHRSDPVGDRREAGQEHHVGVIDVGQERQALDLEELRNLADQASSCLGPTGLGATLPLRRLPQTARVGWKLPVMGGHRAGQLKRELGRRPRREQSVPHETQPEVPVVSGLLVRAEVEAGGRQELAGPVDLRLKGGPCLAEVVQRDREQEGLQSLDLVWGDRQQPAAEGRWCCLRQEPGCDRCHVHHVAQQGVGRARRLRPRLAPERPLRPPLRTLQPSGGRRDGVLTPCGMGAWLAQALQPPLCPLHRVPSHAVPPVREAHAERRFRSAGSVSLRR